MLSLSMFKNFKNLNLNKFIINEKMGVHGDPSYIIHHNWYISYRFFFKLTFTYKFKLLIQKNDCQLISS